MPWLWDLQDHCVNINFICIRSSTSDLVFSWTELCSFNPQIHDSSSCHHLSISPKVIQRGGIVAFCFFNAQRWLFQFIFSTACYVAGKPNHFIFCHAHVHDRFRKGVNRTSAALQTYTTDAITSRERPSATDDCILAYTGKHYNVPKTLFLLMRSHFR